MKKVLFSGVPFDKAEITLALESGVDAVIVEREHVASVQALSKIQVLAAEDQPYVLLSSKADEEEAVRLLGQGRDVILRDSP